YPKRKTGGKRVEFLGEEHLPKGFFVYAEQRFLKTGGAPPEGVKMIGRWHGMSGGGVLIAETNDAKALYSWLNYWNDLLDFDTTPCVEDAEAAEVMAAQK